ncbi:hypothetical protein Vpro01_03247 [Vibrio proteolyticus]
MFANQRPQKTKPANQHSNKKKQKTVPLSIT